MTTKYAIIAASKFNQLNYSEVVRNSFTDVMHRAVPYKCLHAFEQYITGLQFDYVFDSKDELDVFLVYVPISISPRQGMIQLSRMGNLNQAEQTVYNLGTITGDEQVGNEVIITWEKATAWERNDATVLFIAELLKWTNEHIDEFFVNASKIV